MLSAKAQPRIVVFVAANFVSYQAFWFFMNGGFIGLSSEMIEDLLKKSVMARQIFHLPKPSLLKKLTNEIASSCLLAMTMR